MQLDTTVQPYSGLAPCPVVNIRSAIFQKMGNFSENAVRNSIITLVTRNIHLPFLIYSQFFHLWWQFHCKISAASEEILHLLYRQNARDFLKLGYCQEKRDISFDRMVVRMGSKRKVILIESSQFSAGCPSDRNGNKINTIEMWDAVAWIYVGRSLYIGVFHKYLKFTKISKDLLAIIIW